MNITEDEITEDEESFMIKLKVPLHESAVVLDLNTTSIIIEGDFNGKQCNVIKCTYHGDMHTCKTRLWHCSFSVEGVEKFDFLLECSFDSMHSKSCGCHFLPPNYRVQNVTLMCVHECT